ncbi:hypothetical protein [Paenibacillus eucommiae]|uniref:Chromosome segregation ATPase n=1 Tax=Paenibacillus eucommiae TaxID=1355755 RepID=A0ABS4IRN0_9BACL|nr:hypothetical protein [Paenibacillus eucommiae]MBP1990193.1 chromosome segregation ATPase [Paenibacillus eucommiae]
MTELVSGEVLGRLENVEKQIAALSGEMLLLNTETLKHEQQLKILEESRYRHQEEMSRLSANQEVMKSSVAQILSRFDSFESKVFDLLRQMQTDSASERTNSQKEWMTFVKYVLGGTIIAVVYQLFSKGG